MLQALRDRLTGWVAIVIVGILAIPVVFFGIESYFQPQIPTYVAKVGDVEIAPDEFRTRWNEYTSQIRQMLGDNYDAAQFETPDAKRRVLERMIDEQVLYQFADRTGVQVSDTRLKEEIEKIEAFQNNGVFDPNQYQLRLVANQLTPQGFEARVRRDLTSSFLPQKVASSAFVAPAAIDRYLALEDQLRSFRYVAVPAIALSADVPDEAALQAYYDANKDRFRSDERLEFEYVTVDAAGLAPAADPTDDALKARYEAEKARFITAEQRSAAHILVRVAPDAPADAVKAAQEKAARLAAEARDGKDFATLARANSDDLGSRNDGGDLGFIEQGTLQPAFETTLFAMMPGAISDPVKTDDGFHVIRLGEIRPGASRSFDDVRGELLEQARAGARETAFTELVGRMIDQVLADPTNLAEAAKIGSLAVERSGLIARFGAEGLASNPAVQAVVFSASAIANRTVSDPIEIGPNQVAFVRVVEHVPSAPRPLDEVRAAVVQGVQVENAAKASSARAAALEKRLGAGESLDVLAAELGAPVQSATQVGRRSLTVDGQVIAEAFKLERPESGKVTRERAKLADGSYLLIELSEVRDGDPAKADAAARNAARDALLAAANAEQGRAFIAALRDSTEVRIVEERLD